MRGRKPTPTALRVLRGNPGKRPLPENEPHPSPDYPEPPDNLSRDARIEWERVTPILYDLGLLTNIDRAALVGYCVAWGRWMEAEDELRKYGPVVKAPSGYPVQSPFLAVANRAMKQTKEFLAEFGMSPSARTRVVVTQARDTSNRFAKHAKRRGA